MSTELDFRPFVFDALAEVRAERLGRPSLADDDLDLINAIEDLMDLAYDMGREVIKSTRRKKP